MKHPLVLLLFLMSTVAAENKLELTEKTAPAKSPEVHMDSTSDTALNGGCSATIYPPGLNISQGFYASFNDGYPFGFSTHTSFEASIFISTFMSLSGFSFDEFNARRRVVFSRPPSNFRPMASGFYSVSECPGDFTGSAICKGIIYNNSTLLFSTIATDDPSRYCILDPAATYYINFIMSDDPYNVPPSCASPSHSSCAVYYSETALE